MLHNHSGTDINCECLAVTSRTIYCFFFSFRHWLPLSCKTKRHCRIDNAFLLRGDLLNEKFLVSHLFKCIITFWKSLEKYTQQDTCGHFRTFVCILGIYFQILLMLSCIFVKKFYTQCLFQ